MARRDEAPRAPSQRRGQDLRPRHGRVALERGEHPALRARRPSRRSASTGPCSAAIFRSTSSTAPSIRSTALSRASLPISPRAEQDQLFRDNALRTLPALNRRRVRAKDRHGPVSPAHAGRAICRRRRHRTTRPPAATSIGISAARTRSASCPTSPLRACDAVVAWHEMKIDARFCFRFEALPHHRPRRRRLRPHRSRGGGRGAASRSATHPTTAPARSPTTPSV